MAKITGNNQANTLNGTSGKDQIKGKGGADIVNGLGGNDKIDGGKGNDTISGGSGNDSIDGGKGSDTAVYSGLRSQYVITRKRSDDDDHGHGDHDDDNGHGQLSVRDTVPGRDGTDSLKNVEFLQFADGTYNVNTGVFTDTLAPTVAVDILDLTQSDGNNSSEVTFTFSEAPVGFTASDITAVGGTVTGLAATGNPLVYTATFNATDGFDGSGSVTVVAASYTDAAGNPGAGGADNVAIDTKNPSVTVDILDGSLSDTDNVSEVTFSFSEATTDFDFSDVTVAGGTLGPISGSGTSYTATFMADDDFDGTGSVTVNAESYTDAAGNAGAGDDDTVPIDTTNPPPLVVAYINSDRIDGYSQENDTLIAGLFDSNGDGTPSPGDTLQFDFYPMDFDALQIGEFLHKSQPVVSVYFDSDIQSFLITTLSGVTYVTYQFGNDSEGYTEELFKSNHSITFSDVVSVGDVYDYMEVYFESSYIDPSMPDSLVPYTIGYPGSGDQPFFNVDFLI